MKVCSWAVFVFAAAGRSFHLNDGLAVDGYNSTLPYLGASSAQLPGRLSSQIACGLSSRKERGEECAAAMQPYLQPPGRAPVPGMQG